jgi:hypothetical protein
MFSKIREVLIEEMETIKEMVHKVMKDLYKYIIERDHSKELLNTHLYHLRKE